MRALSQVLEHIDALEAPRILVCIDGPAGAGKTTLAAAMESQRDDVTIIHMDELYNGWDDALSADLAHRLASHIRDPFLDGDALTYATYDWFAFRFNAPITLDPKRILVVEGVGAAQRCLRERAHFTVFIEIDTNKGRERVVQRDGDVVADHIDAWQRAERMHFETDATRESVDLVLSSEPN